MFSIFVWDVQKDILMDTCWAIFAIIVHWINKKVID